ncbi:hypothetical protein M2155_008130 [Streptomyces sp. SAI-119]|nr:hypothetical protein [Streptomyces sp. SAI-119]
MAVGRRSNGLAVGSKNRWPTELISMQSSQDQASAAGDRCHRGRVLLHWPSCTASAGSWLYRVLAMGFRYAHFSTDLKVSDWRPVASMSRTSTCPGSAGQRPCEETRLRHRLLLRAAGSASPFGTVHRAALSGPARNDVLLADGARREPVADDGPVSDSRVGRHGNQRLPGRQPSGRTQKSRAAGVGERLGRLRGGRDEDRGVLLVEDVDVGFLAADDQRVPRAALLERTQGRG